MGGFWQLQVEGDNVFLCVIFPMLRIIYGVQGGYWASSVIVILGSDVSPGGVMWQSCARSG